MTTSTTTPSPNSSKSDTLAGPVSEIRVDPTAKRIRVFLGGALLADSTTARLAYATGRHPEYLIPAADVAWTGLEMDGVDCGQDMFGPYRSIREKEGAQEVGRRYSGGPAADYASFVFECMDSWFEEDEQVWFHPRDPFRRVEVTESSRHVEIAVNGQTVARSDRPRLVTETGLPARWYLPRSDVDWSKLTPSTTTSGCQYKGLADWWHVRTDDSDQLADVVWGYERPVPEASKLAGLVAFYAEHAAVETSVDGTTQPNPVLSAGALNPSLGLSNVAADHSASPRSGQKKVLSNRT
jgi:uncharacterized protein (DUF427 family)